MTVDLLICLGWGEEGPYPVDAFFWVELTLVPSPKARQADLLGLQVKDV